MCLVISSHTPALVIHPHPYPVTLPASSSSLLMVTLPIPQSPGVSIYVCIHRTGFCDKKKHVTFVILWPLHLLLFPSSHLETRFSLSIK